MKRTLVLAFLASILLVAPSGASAVEFQAGEPDDFAASTELASPSADLINQVPGSYLDFDAAAPNARVGHTFTSLPTDISTAMLEIRLRAGDGGACMTSKPCQNMSETDVLLLAFSDQSGRNNVWGREIGTTLGLTEGLLSSPWLPGTEHTFNLNLAALPLEGGGTFDLVDLLNTHGFLDVLVADDTAVDFMRLSVGVVPEPSTMLLLGGGLFVLAALRSGRRAESGC